jgi:hypothetical protein
MNPTEYLIRDRCLNMLLDRGGRGLPAGGQIGGGTTVSDRQYREQLLHDSVVGKPWRTKDGRRRVTDKEMVNLCSIS